MVPFLAPKILELGKYESSLAPERHLIAGEVPENMSCRVDQAKERTQGSNQENLKKHSGKMT